MSRRLRAPIWLVLALAFAGLVLVTTAVIAGRLYTAAFRSTGELVAEMGDQRLTALSEALKAELQPAQDSSNFIAQYILSGGVSLADDRRIEDLLLGSLAASPQVIGVALIRPDLYAVAAARTSGGEPFATSAGSALTDPLFRLAWRTGAAMPGPDWGPPLYAPGLKVSGLPLLAPLRRNGEVIAVVATLISVPELATHVLQRVGDGGVTAFVLLDDNSVLVHPALATGRFAPTVDQPLPTAAQLSDPILNAFHPMQGDDPSMHPRVPLKFFLQQAVINDVRRLYLFRKIDVIGSRPWTAALVFNAAELEGEFQSLRIALWVSIGVATLAAFAAILLGRSISRPIHDFAAAARRLAALEIDRTQPMRGSWLREFDMAAEAYNGMRSGLTWLSTYVPRALVPVLMQPESAASFTSKEREVTVLFTDIVGFTAIGQRLSAPALARFINRHFAMLGMAIEAEGGTIDKYIGDSVMAFWGAPSAQADHAERAVRAALEIARRMRSDNERRRRKGFNPVRMRIGIHSGLALAGNIGAPGRINYTLVGDTVNVAQRLEQFGKEIDDGQADVIIAVSRAVADRLPVEIETVPLGTHRIMERGEPVEVYRIVAPPAEAPAETPATPPPD
ncbi:MAG TPA: adenylate/guanylate cyclase domain-containing protein [Dongiaceae bacterium]|nr:adenylate/guanylate cyclase domain-containing protein [Dongiaceae bacterium]